MKYKELKKFHQLIQEDLQYERSVCKKGCTYCCTQSVELWQLEIKSIKEFIVNILPENIKKQLKENTRKWLDFYYDYIKDIEDVTLEDITVELNNVMVERNIKCPLLINNACSLYARRPISCRTYYESRSNTFCEKNPLEVKGNKGTELQFHLVAFFETDPDTYLYPINFVLAEIFFPEEEIEMAKRLREDFNGEMKKMIEKKRIF